MKNIKRILSVCVALLMLLSLVGTAFAVTLEEKELAPGSLHTYKPSYQMSWLNKLIIRDDATAIATARLVPKADYPYDVTYEQFLLEVENCMTVYGINEETITDDYRKAIDMLYYSAAALGMLDDTETMYKKLSDEGIRIPVEMTAEEKVEAAVVYAELKYNLTYALFGKDTTFTKGRSIEGAAVDILATAMDSTLPSDVDTIRDIALLGVKNVAQSYGEELPMSENPNEEELFYFLKTILSSKQGYAVPKAKFEELTEPQKQYVDCTYYASVLDTMYDITINPLELAKVAEENDVEKIARLVLETKLREANVKHNKSAALENLFTLCCENGLFPMDEEFYTDVFDYDVYVPQSTEKLWFTPFGLADQLGGDNKFLSVKLNGKKMLINSTAAAKLDTSKKTEKVTLVVNYEDETGYSDSTTYIFKVFKEKDAEVQSGTGLVGEIESQLNRVIPADSEKANQIIGGMVTRADEIVSKGEALVTADKAVSDNITEPSAKDETTTTQVETFKIEETTYAVTTKSDKFDFGYLEQLVDETFGDDDNKLTSDYTLTDSVTKANDGFVAHAVEAVKESPEIVVAPTSVIGAGALAGYLFTRRKKTRHADEGIEEILPFDDDKD